MRWRIYSSNKVSLHLTISFSISASQFPKFSRTHISSIIMRFEWIHVIPGWSFDSRYTLMATPRHRLLRIFRRHIGRTEKWFAPQAQCEHFEWKLLGSHDRFGNGSIRTFCQNSNRTQNLIEFQLTWKKLNRIVPRKMWPKITLWMHKISFFFFFLYFVSTLFRQKFFTSITAFQMAVRVANSTVYMCLQSSCAMEWAFLLLLWIRSSYTSNRCASDRCLLSCKLAHTPPICLQRRTTKPRYTWKQMKYVHVYTRLFFQYILLCGRLSSQIYI